VRLGDYVDEIRSFGLERLQALDFATVAAIVSVHTDLQRIRDASDREVRVLEGELAGSEAFASLPSLQPGRLRPRA